MSRYDALREYLLAQSAETVTLRLVEIDAIVKLPAPAKRYDFWWSNDDVRTTMHVQCRAWQEAGYKAEPNLRGKTVTFRRSAA
jgi:hypothetical protein